MASSKQRYKNNHHLLRDHSNYKKAYKNEKYINHIKLSSDDCKEQPRCDFSALPDEMILSIFKNLDKKTLYQVSRVNRRFFIITRDYSLIPHCLNLRNTDRPFIYNIIYFLVGSIYENVQQLDLTSSNISVSYLVKLLNICGKRLTHLRLSGCRFVDTFALFKISMFCKNLKVLDLSYCDQMRAVNGFLYLERLEFLEDLDLSWTRITAEPLCKILQNNRRMRNLNLSHVFIRFKLNVRFKHVEIVMIQLGNSCPDLEKLDITGNGITSRGINALAKCNSLRKLNVDGLICNEKDYSDDDIYYGDKEIRIIRIYESIPLSMCNTPYRLYEIVFLLSTYEGSPFYTQINSLRNQSTITSA